MIFKQSGWYSSKIFSDTTHSNNSNLQWEGFRIQDSGFLLERLLDANPSPSMTVDKEDTPYLFELTKKGEEYGEHIWMNCKDYNFDRYRLFQKISQRGFLRHKYVNNHDDDYQKIYKKYMDLIYSVMYDIDDPSHPMYEKYIKKNEDKQSPINDSPPMYLIDEILKELMKEKERYKMDDMDFNRRLLLTDITLKGPIDLKKEDE